MPRLIIAWLLDPTGTGAIQILPPHVTLLPWFRLDERAVPALVDRLNIVSALRTPVEIRLGDTALFGEQQDIPVRLVHPKAEVLSLHEDLRRIVTSAGAVLDAPQWCGEGYRPHMTINRDPLVDRLNTGLLLDHFVLIQSVETGPFRLNLRQVFRCRSE